MQEERTVAIEVLLSLGYTINLSSNDIISCFNLLQDYTSYLSSFQQQDSKIKDASFMLMVITYAIMHDRELFDLSSMCFMQINRSEDRELVTSVSNVLMKSWMNSMVYYFYSNNREIPWSH